MNTPDERRVEKQHYLQLFEYHWTALATPKNSPILTLWIPPAFRMRVLLLWINALEVSNDSVGLKYEPIVMSFVKKL
jgi:hypothetical protein